MFILPSGTTRVEYYRRKLARNLAHLPSWRDLMLLQWTFNFFGKAKPRLVYVRYEKQERLSRYCKLTETLCKYVTKKSWRLEVGSKKSNNENTHTHG